MTLKKVSQLCYFTPSGNAVTIPGHEERDSRVYKLDI